MLQHRFVSANKCHHQMLRYLSLKVGRGDFFIPGRTSSITDTIFALSSGPMVKSGVAVIRLSGPSCKYALEALQNPTHCSSSSSSTSSTLPPAYKYPRLPSLRKASLRRLYCPKSGEELDRAIVLWMPGPHSFTGEDVCELHVHGSRAVITGVFEALQYLDNPHNNRGIRAADRGEFTRRAFDNGRMDLTEIEGLSDLLEADTSLQRSQALKQMDGHLSRKFEQWRQVLVKCLAHTEAVIDFGDDDREDDVSDSALMALLPTVNELRSEIEFHLKDGRRGELVREGVRVVLVGPPNAGKSSLMNTLARRPAAIVSPTAGTTRDIVEVRMEFGGIPCLLSDTAGLRDKTDDQIELEGIRRAKESFRRAHIQIFVGDCSNESEMMAAKSMFASLLNEENEEKRLTGSQNNNNISNSSMSSKILLVLNKCDLLASATATASASASTDSLEILTLKSPEASNVFKWKWNNLTVPSYLLSCTTGKGLPELEESISSHIKNMLETGMSSDMESTLITRERHRRHLQMCAEHLDNFLDQSLLMDSAAEELRLAAMELGRVTGRVDVEELLDVIFKDFCIGK